MNNISSKVEIAKFWGKHNRIKELKGTMTLVELCDAIDLDQGNLSKMLNGQTSIYLFRLVQIAEALGYKPAELLPLEWQNNAPAQDKDEIYKNIYIVAKTVEEYLLKRKKTLTPEDKAELIAGLTDRVSSLPTEKREAKIIEITDFILNMKRTG